MYRIYILYSKILNKYYIGSTGDQLGERIRRHNSNHQGFTGRTSDWALAYQEAYPDKSSAIKREQQLKGWKSRKMIEKLINEA